MQFIIHTTNIVLVVFINIHVALYSLYSVYMYNIYMKIIDIFLPGLIYMNKQFCFQNNGMGSPLEEKDENPDKRFIQTPLQQDIPSEYKENIYKNGDNVVICDRENCYEYMSRDPSTEYCRHAVRKAFWSKPPSKAFPSTVFVAETVNKRGKSLSRFLKRKEKNIMDPLEGSTDNDSKNNYLTMPELKQKRQTSIGLFKRTCTKPGCWGAIEHGVTTEDSQFNASYTPDETEVTNAGTIELQDELLTNHKFQHKKLCLKRTDQLFHNDNPVELIATDEAAINVFAPKLTPTSLPTRNVCHMREVEDIVSVRDNEVVTLQIDRDSKIDDDSVTSDGRNVTKKQEPYRGCAVSEQH